MSAPVTQAVIHYIADAPTRRDAGPVGFGAYVRELLKNRKVSKAELARRLDVSWTTVNDWERKDAIPDGGNLAGIVRALDLTAEETAKLNELARTGRPDVAMPAHQNARQSTVCATLEAAITYWPERWTPSTLAAARAVAPTAPERTARAWTEYLDAVEEALQGIPLQSVEMRDDTESIRSEIASETKATPQPKRKAR